MADDEAANGEFAQWAIVELMGHRRLAGWISEATVFGTTLLRIDIPKDDAGATSVTQFYAPSALYCITPTTEEIARSMAKSFRPQPVQRYELEGAAF